MSANLNVLIACPLEAHLAARVASLATVADVSYDPDLLPIARYPNDHSGTPRERTTAQIDRWNEMLARADVLFGYPDESAAGLRDSLERGTRIRFVQGTSAGMGAHIRRADVGPEILERVAFASAAGVHGGMLAEFAFYGLLTLRKDARRLATIRANRAWDHYTMGELEGSTLAIVGMGQNWCCDGYTRTCVRDARHRRYPQRIPASRSGRNRLDDRSRFACAAL